MSDFDDIGDFVTSTPAGSTSVSVVDVRAVCSAGLGRLRRSNAVLASRVERMLKHEPFAEVGHRHDTIRDVSMWLAGRLPSGCPAAVIADLFGSSLAVMRRVQSDVPDDSEVLRAVQSAIDKVAAERLEQERTHASHAAVRNAISRGQRAREPYTADEFAAMAGEDGVTVDELRRRLLVAVDGGVFIRFGDGYRGPYSRAEAVDVARDALAAASSVGVALSEVGPRGRRLLTLSEVLDRYGSSADKIRYDLTATRTRLDAVEREVVIAPCPLRPLEPFFDEQIDRWLRALFGARYDHCAAWLATVTELDQPTSALVLLGPTGVGKSLLAYGLARLWSRGPSPLGRALERFNDAILQCPVLLADEDLPRDVRGADQSEKLRELIGAHSHVVERKYRSPANAHGAVRVVIALNSTRPLQFGSDLTRADLEAIAARLTQVHCGEAARASLVGVDTSAWVEGDGIARHCLALSRLVAVARGSRFLVPGDADGLVNELVARTGLRPRAMELLVRDLFGTHPPANDHTATRVHGGQVYVHLGRLLRTWDTVVKGGGSAPELSRFTRAASELLVSGAEGRREFMVDGRRVAFRRVRDEALVQYIVDADVDEEELRAALVRLDGRHGAG